MKSYIRESRQLNKNTKQVTYYTLDEYWIYSIICLILAMLIYTCKFLVSVIYNGIRILYEFIIKGIIGIVLILRKALIIRIEKNRVDTGKEYRIEVKTYKDYEDKITPIVKKISKVLAIISVACAIWAGAFIYNIKHAETATDNNPAVTETKDNE